MEDRKVVVRQRNERDKNIMNLFTFIYPRFYFDKNKREMALWSMFLKPY